MESKSNSKTWFERSIAVTSGKGGVGKTTTAVNLALYYARNGVSTALVDLDPLSDIATFLDIASPEATLGATGLTLDSGIDEHALKPFSNLEILFPDVKLDASSSSTLYTLLSGKLVDTLNERYEVLILDLPAGAEEETNLRFLDLATTVLLVTNPEPTAHASAGGYCRAVFDRRPDSLVHVWHNRFRLTGPDGFNPRDVIANYNRNATEELRLSDAERTNVTDVAFVPEDPALNMLQTGIPDPSAIVLRSMLSLCRQIADHRAEEVLSSSGMSVALRRFAAAVLGRDHAIDEPIDELVTEVELLAVDTLGSHVGARVAGLSRLVRANPEFSLLGLEKRRKVSHALDKVRSDGLWMDAKRAGSRVAAAIETRSESSRAFADKDSHREQQTLSVAEEGVRALLVACAERRVPTADSRNAQVLLFYLSFFKLLNVASIQRKVREAVPVRRVKTKKGRSRNRERDRLLQISYLVAGDDSYRSVYVDLLRTLYPVLTRQVAALSRALGADTLLIRARDGQVEKRAYLTLFSNALHDCLFSGLGVITGFRYREASRAFAEGADAIARRHGLEVDRPASESA